MGNNKRYGAVIALFIIILMFTSLFGGYKFITKLRPDVDSKFNEVAQDKLGIDIEAIREARRREDETARLERQKERELEKENNEKPEKREVADSIKSILNEPYTYKNQNTRSYDGPRIMTVDTYIVNTEGKVLKDFINDEMDHYSFSMNVDGSEGIIRKDGSELYYFDAELEPVRIAGDVKAAGMCYDGGYFYYITSTSSSPYDLYVYDVAGKKSVRVDEVNQFDAVISPDGHTVAYYKYAPSQGIYVCRLGEESRQVVAGSGISLFSVSNDGQTLFYDCYSEDHGVYCYNSGARTLICDEYIHTCFFDRECRQILFEESEKIKYYRAGDENTLELLDDSYFEYHISNARCTETRFGSNHYIIDTDCFSDVLVMDDYTNYYVLKGDTPAMFCLNDDIVGMHSVRIAMLDDGPVFSYVLGGNLYKARYDGNIVTKKVILEGGDRTMAGYTTNKDLSEFWVSFYGSSSLQYKSADEEFTEIYLEGDRSAYDIRWNPLDGKCYYVIGKELYSCGDASQEPALITDEVAWLSYTMADEDFICLKKEYEDKNDFVILYDEILPLH